MHLLKPSLSYLLRLQAQARLARMLRGFTNRRRVVLSCVAAVFAILWLGNAILSVLVRPPASPEYLQAIVPLALLSYAAWHFVKTAYQRPEFGIEWTPAETEYLHTAPYTPVDLIVYRLATIVGATLIKAVCLGMLLLPDLQYPVIGMVGVVVALVFIDVVRLLLEIWCWGLSDRSYLTYRITVLSLFAFVSGLGLWLGYSAWCETTQDPTSVFTFLNLGVDTGTWMLQTPVGQCVAYPFQFFAGLMLANQLDANLLLDATVSIGLLLAACRLTIVCDRWATAQRLIRERDDYRQASVQVAANKSQTTLSLRAPSHLAGLGPIIWRQLLGVRHYGSQVLMAFVAPAILSCLPLLVTRDPGVSFRNVAAGLAFYSFLLLPAALKFDFRRDLDRMNIFKCLPVSSFRIVVGQLATPILLTSLFQLVVLGTAAIIQPCSLLTLVVCLSSLWVLNVIIFALDNLLYLWYPYRMNQEGIEIFLRTTLTFTGKGFLFALALAAVLAWAAVAGWLTSAIPNWQPYIFLTGLLTGLAATAALCVWQLTRAYHRFDPGQDVPA